MTRGNGSRKLINITDRIATWNIHGKLYQELNEQKYDLIDDMERLKIQICCLQETKMTRDTDVSIPTRGRIINIAARTPLGSRQWGLGFYISEEWKELPMKYEYVTDRIAVLQIKKLADQKKQYTVVNVYAPTRKIPDNN